MSYGSMATDLHEYIVKNSLGRVVLLGHSMGGKAAIAFSTMYPELVEKLIVVDIAPVTYT
jgi:esterase